MNKKQILVLSRFVYLISFALKPRFPSVSVSFMCPGQGHLLVCGHVKKQSREGQFNNALVDLLDAVGFGDFNSEVITVGGVMGEDVDSLESTQIIRLKFDGVGGIKKLISSLDKMLPQLPKGIVAPEVMIEKTA